MVRAELPQSLSITRTFRTRPATHVKYHAFSAILWSRVRPMHQLLMLSADRAVIQRTSGAPAASLTALGSLRGCGRCRLVAACLTGVGAWRNGRVSFPGDS